MPGLQGSGGTEYDRATLGKMIVTGGIEAEQELIMGMKSENKLSMMGGRKRDVWQFVFISSRLQRKT